MGSGDSHVREGNFFTIAFNGEDRRIDEQSGWTSSTASSTQCTSQHRLQGDPGDDLELQQDSDHSKADFFITDIFIDGDECDQLQG